jgi:hypothetical protein
MGKIIRKQEVLQSPKKTKMGKIRQQEVLQFQKALQKAMYESLMESCWRIEQERKEERSATKKWKLKKQMMNEFKKCFAQFQKFKKTEKTVEENEIENEK